MSGTDGPVLHRNRLFVSSNLKTQVHTFMFTCNDILLSTAVTTSDLGKHDSKSPNLEYSGGLTFIIILFFIQHGGCNFIVVRNLVDAFF